MLVEQLSSCEFNSISPTHTDFWALVISDQNIKLLILPLRLNIDQVVDRYSGICKQILKNSVGIEIGHYSGKSVKCELPAQSCSEEHKYEPSMNKERDYK